MRLTDYIVDLKKHIFLLLDPNMLLRTGKYLYSESNEFNVIWFSLGVVCALYHLGLACPTDAVWFVFCGITTILSSGISVAAATLCVLGKSRISNTSTQFGFHTHHILRSGALLVPPILFVAACANLYAISEVNIAQSIISVNQLRAQGSRIEAASPHILRAIKFAPHNGFLLGMCSILSFRANLLREQAECESLIFGITERGYTYPYFRKPCDAENTILGWLAVCMDKNNQGLDKEALLACKHLIEIEPLNPEWYRLRASLDESVGRVSLARIDQEKAAQLMLSGGQIIVDKSGASPLVNWLTGSGSVTFQEWR